MANRVAGNQRRHCRISPRNREPLDRGADLIVIPVRVSGRTWDALTRDTSGGQRYSDSPVRTFLTQLISTARIVDVLALAPAWDHPLAEDRRRSLRFFRKETIRWPSWNRPRG